MFSSPNLLVTYFRIAHSFILDGINEYFAIPNASLVGTLAGSNKKFSISTLIKRNSTGAVDGLFAGWNSGQLSLLFRFLADDTINIIFRDSGNKQAITTDTYTDTSEWYFITLSYDFSQSLGNRISIFVNGVAATMASDTTTTNIDSTTTTYDIATQDGITNSHDGNQSLFYIRDQPTTLAEHIKSYNKGKPISGEAQFGSEIVYEFNPDNSGFIAQFAVTNNSITANSINLEDSDKTTETPY